MIREEVRDVSNIRVERKTEGAEPDSVTSAREEPEAPRAELPEWLAKELFRIFV
jgi:hypothetical protein